MYHLPGQAGSKMFAFGASQFGSDDCVGNRCHWQEHIFWLCKYVWGHHPNIPT